jgi:Mrp family chromosome partitioning ATPase
MVPWSAGATPEKAAAPHEKTSGAEEKIAEEKDGAPSHIVAADALPQAEHETPVAEPKRFKPIWEVDRFSWSPEINRLYDAESKYFGYAGVKLREASREGLRVLGIASARAGDGCTTLAICLARAASDAGVKVALLDANTDQPQLAARLGVKFSHGWQGAIAGETPLSETAIISLDNAMTLLPLSASSRDELTSLDDPKVTELVQTIATGVDLVVIDLGHMGSNSTCRFERGANCPIDAAIVVRDVRRTSEQQTLAVAGRLKECGIDAVGIAENYAPPDSTAKTAAA